MVVAFLIRRMGDKILSGEEVFATIASSRRRSGKVEWNDEPFAVLIVAASVKTETDASPGGGLLFQRATAAEISADFFLSTSRKETGYGKKTLSPSKGQL